MIEVKPATLSDAEALAPRVREADRREIDAASGTTPLESLTAAVTRSRIARSVWRDGTVIAMYGVTDWPDGEAGFPWMVASDEIEKTSARDFRNFTRRCVEELQAASPKLYGTVDARNHKHLRWLKWGGFQIGDTFNIGRNGEAFHSFWRF
jgi:hypothetical protein